MRDLAGPDGRAGSLRRLRTLAADGTVSLEWTLLGAGAGPRYERWVAADRDRPPSRAKSCGRGEGGRAAAGPKQQAVLEALAAEVAGELPGADLSARFGSGAVAGLVRRGLAEAEVRERPRRPLATRPVGRRGGRPPAAT